MPGYARKRTRVAISHALRDLGAALRNEVDLRREATSLEWFGRRLRSNPKVRVPVVYRQWSSGRALVMEELIGEPLSVYRARAKADPDAARRGGGPAVKESIKKGFEGGRLPPDTPARDPK